MPALSSEVSLLSSHRSFRGSRKPCGGGPAGVAAREAEEEKAAVARGNAVRAESVALGGAKVVSVRARPAMCLVEAMATDCFSSRAVRDEGVKGKQIGEVDMEP